MHSRVSSAALSCMSSVRNIGADGCSIALSSSTLQYSILELNMTLSLAATDGPGWKECCALKAVYFDFQYSFSHSLYLAASNGDSNPLISTTVVTSTKFNYSSILYTLDDGYPRLSLIPTATYLSTSHYTMFPDFTMPSPHCSKLFHVNCVQCYLSPTLLKSIIGQLEQFLLILT